MLGVKLATQVVASLTGREESRATVFADAAKAQAPFLGGQSGEFPFGVVEAQAGETIEAVTYGGVESFEGSAVAAWWDDPCRKHELSKRGALTEQD